MKCVYELDAVCTCPVDKRGDYYRVTVTSTKEILVERIVEAVKAEGAVEQTQESLTNGLSRRLGAVVTTVGNHSGVKATITCGGE